MITQHIKMKKIKQTVSALLLASISLCAQAQNVKAELKLKLDNMHPFSADFKQVVTSAEGDNLLVASGTMQLQRPNKFRWETKAPDEQMIVSNGHDLWFYNPFVEQVSIYTLDDAIANTPFMLIVGGDDNAWKKYNVTFNKGIYTVKMSNKTTAKVFTLAFNKNEISEFTIQESQGQHSSFTLTNYQQKNFNASLFEFRLPENTDIDDQR